MTSTFYPEVVVGFTVTETGAHHHVPLLLSPFAYSTYRGAGDGRVLGANRYGKAEIRLMRVDRDRAAARAHDLTVSIALSGEMEAVHLTGDNTAVLPTDTQKNTVYAFAREHGVGQVEEFAILLARHFVDTQPAVHGAPGAASRSTIWDRIGRPLGSHRTRAAQTRTHDALVALRPRAPRSSPGCGPVLLNSTDSEFRGFAKDRYTTLPETDDRILATAVQARWRSAGSTATGRRPTTASARRCCRVRRHLQPVAAADALRDGSPGAVTSGRGLEVRLRLPNQHHFLVDLEPVRHGQPR